MKASGSSGAELQVGAQAPGFALPGTDGRTHTLQGVAGRKGTVIVFLSNHCPYVRAITGRLVKAAEDMRAFGVETAAICCNDASRYPQDSFANMQAFAKQHGYSFPYLRDESQDVARAYGALCTPDFFGFDRELKLKYRGRLDMGRTGPVPEDARCELVEAMRQIAETGAGPEQQVPSMGCSIKWKA